MRQRWWVYLVLGLVLYTLLLLATAPAGWLAWGTARLSKGRVTLFEPRGSVWSGSAGLVLHLPPAAPERFGQIDWDVNPLWLLRGRAQARLKLSAPELDVHGVVRVGYKTIRITKAAASFPSQLVRRFYPAAALFDPRGRLHASAAGVQLGADGLRGNAEVLWQDAATSLSSVQPLGDYRVVVSAQGRAADLRLETVRGDLALSGTGQWQPFDGGVLRLNGHARAQGRASELAPLLQTLGPAQPDGGHPLNLTLSFPVPAGAWAR